MKHNYSFLVLVFVSLSFCMDRGSSKLDSLLKRARSSKNNAEQMQNKVEFDGVNPSIVGPSKVSDISEEDLIDEDEPPIVQSSFEENEFVSSLNSRYVPIVEYKKTLLKIDTLDFIIKNIENKTVEIAEYQQSTIESHQFTMEREKAKFDFWLNLAKALGGVAGTLATMVGGIIGYKKLMGASKPSKEDLKEAVKEAVEEAVEEATEDKKKKA